MSPTSDIIATLHQPTLLVVDDDDDNRRLLRLRLGRTSNVLEAENGVAALSTLERERVDLVLLDVMMPGLSGLDVCRRVKAVGGPFLPVVLLSALTDAHDRNAGLAAGADAYLTKPIDSVELSLCVQRLLDQRALDLLLRRKIREVEQMTQLKDDLVELLVHDLRNPLASMLASLEMVRRSEAAPEADRELAELAWVAGSRMKSVLEELLAVTQLERGELTPSMAPLELNEVAAAAVSTLSAAARASRVPVTFEPFERTEVMGDRAMVLRAMENLLANALRHTKSMVRVSVTRTATDAVVAIADDGPGVPDALKEGLFEKYGGLELNARNLRRGFGLGLYVVRLVTQAHGGRAEVDDREGGGAVFRLVFPLPA